MIDLAPRLDCSAEVQRGSKRRPRSPVKEILGGEGNTEMWVVVGIYGWHVIVESSRFDGLKVGRVTSMHINYVLGCKFKHGREIEQILFEYSH